MSHEHIIFVDFITNRNEFTRSETKKLFQKHLHPKRLHYLKTSFCFTLDTKFHNSNMEDGKK